MVARVKIKPKLHHRNAKGQIQFTLSQSSPDIDVLETKLTDKDGREGTAQLPEEVHLEKESIHSASEASESTKATNFSRINLEPVTTEGEGLKPDLDNQELGIESTKSTSKMLESENVDPVIQPTIPPSAVSYTHLTLPTSDLV